MPSASRAGCISSRASCGSACSTTSTSSQIPGLAAAAADKGGPGGAGISKYIAPRALLWFRWAALATWLTGAWYLGKGFGNAFTLGNFGQDAYGLTIGIGAWLGTIMLFNVWVLIWPNQKKMLGIVAGHR